MDFDIKTMRYLGNKTPHLKFIYQTISNLINNDELKPTILDGFAGTGAVTHFFNKNNFHIISNDINNYSYNLCYTRNSITINDIPFNNLGMNLDEVIHHLNTCRKQGFVYKNYSPNKDLNHERKYFTNENAEIIDGIRNQIDEWFHSNQISLNEKIFLIALLVETTSLYSNIPGTYGAFNKNWDSRSLKKLELNPDMIPNLLASHNNPTYCGDICSIIKEIECDILYLDPPYNERDYSMYYHVWKQLLRMIIQNSKIIKRGLKSPIASQNGVL